MRGFPAIAKFYQITLHTSVSIHEPTDCTVLDHLYRYAQSQAPEDHLDLDHITANKLKATLQTINIWSKNEGNFHDEQFLFLKFEKMELNLSNLFTFRYSQSWWPLRTKYIQTNTSITIDIRMINTSGKRYLKINAFKKNLDAVTIIVKNLLAKFYLSVKNENP